MIRPPAESRHSRSFLVASALVALVASTGAAQTTIENTLRQYGAETVKGYIQPLADLFAGNMGSGFYHSAAIPGGVHFGIELVAMAGAVKDEHRSYIATTPPGFTPETFETATIFGGTGTTVQHSTNPALSYKGSDGFVDAEYLPFAIPQIRLSIMGFEGIGRYFKSSLISSLPEEDFPETELLGLGVRTGLNRFLPVLPLDVSVGVFWNSFEMGDMVAFDGLSVGAQASKNFSVLTVYGGAASEKGTMNLSYTSTNPDFPGEVDVDLDVERHIRFTGGLALRLGPLHLFGDASTGGETVYSGGIRLLGF
jgi:hypothetical protein